MISAIAEWLIALMKLIAVTGAGAGAGAGAGGVNDGSCNGIVMGLNTGGGVNTISGISNTSLIITCDVGLFASFCGTISAVM